MSTVSSFFFTAGCILPALCEFARYALGFGWALLVPKVCSLRVCWRQKGSWL